MPALLSTDPVVFARDENNDIIIPLRIARGIEAVLILVRTALLLWRDELALNRDVGMPWIETEDGVVTERDAILGQPYDAAKIARVVRKELLAVNGVLGVIQFASSFDAETRTLAVSLIVRTAFGDSPLTTVALAA